MSAYATCRTWCFADCPYTWSDTDGLRVDALWARLDGALIEMPAVTAARRLLARAKALGEKAVSPSRENR